MDVSGQTRPLDGRIARLAERQHGVVARRQLLALGASRQAIEVRLRKGHLHRLHQGVYAVGHMALTQKSRWTAAVLFCGPRAVLSHRSAAALWGLRGGFGGAIEVTAPAKSRSRGSIRRHAADLAADEVTSRDGIAVTTVPRTIFDLAVSSGAQAVEHAIGETERLRLYDALSLEDLLERHPRHRGSAVLRECLGRLRESPAGVTREELEARFLAFIDSRGIPRPRLNSWVMVGSHRYQVDCLWPGQRIVIELDGYGTHGTRTAFERDRERDRRLAVAGYTSIRITWRQLRDEPSSVARDLAELLRVASRGPSGGRM